MYVNICLYINIYIYIYIYICMYIYNEYTTANMPCSGSTPYTLCPRSSTRSGQTREETLIIHKLGSMKFYYK